MCDEKYIVNDYLFWGPTPIIIGLQKRSLYVIIGNDDTNQNKLNHVLQ